LKQTNLKPVLKVIVYMPSSLNGKEVCYAFREFYQSQNGNFWVADIEYLINKSILVQFFENAIGMAPEKSGDRVVAV
jgi:hypothetical protein